MESGIVYALCAGIFWGTSPVLVKRGLAGADVSAATLYQQATILLTLLVSALLEGDLFAGKIPSRRSSYLCWYRRRRRLSGPHAVRQKRRSDRRLAGAIAQQFLTVDHRAVGGGRARRAPVFCCHDRRDVHYLRRVFRDSIRDDAGRQGRRAPAHSGRRLGDALLRRGAGAEKIRHGSTAARRCLARWSCTRQAWRC